MTPNIMLSLSEVFHSLQGEGAYSGVPSWFIRFNGCNLRCSWCDTPYTSWKPEGRALSLDSLLLEFRSQHSRTHHYVITGGEPMIWPQQVTLLIEAIRKQDGDAVITIETNGTRYHDEVLPNLWSVSPKLETSAPDSNHPAERFLHNRNNLLNNLPRFSEKTAAQFKFVVTCPGDLDEVENIRAAYGISPRQVIIMPEGNTAEAQLKALEWLPMECIKRGIRFMPRQHVLIWGPKRGV